MPNSGFPSSELSGIIVGTMEAAILLLSGRASLVVVVVDASTNDDLILQPAENEL